MEVAFVSDACKKAEALVREVPEPTYRIAAFQVVLGRLLSDREPAALGAPKVPRPT